MSAPPLVTVIMPVFNASATLAQALGSVLWQGYEAIEVIAVDDGSTDDSRQLLATYGDAARVLHQSQQGPAAARNLALQHARGEYIAFLDADDVWLPGKLLSQVAYLQAHPDVSAVFGRFMRWETPTGERRFAEPPARAAYEQAATRWRQQPEPFKTTALKGDLYADLLLDSVVVSMSRSARLAIGLSSSRSRAMASFSDSPAWVNGCRRRVSLNRFSKVLSSASVKITSGRGPCRASSS